MTVFCSHQDRLHELADVTRSPIASSLGHQDVRRLGASLRRTVNRIITAFGSRTDWPLEPAARQNGDLNSSAAKFPQRTLILGDKWDF